MPFETIQDTIQYLSETYANLGYCILQDYKQIEIQNWLPYHEKYKCCAVYQYWSSNEMKIDFLIYTPTINPMGNISFSLNDMLPRPLMWNNNISLKEAYLYTSECDSWIDTSFELMYKEFVSYIKEIKNVVGISKNRKYKKSKKVISPLPLVAFDLWMKGNILKYKIQNHNKYRDYKHFKKIMQFLLLKPIIVKEMTKIT